MKRPGETRRAAFKRGRTEAERQMAAAPERKPTTEFSSNRDADDPYSFKMHPWPCPYCHWRPTDTDQEAT